VFHKLLPFIPWVALSTEQISSRNLNIKRMMEHIVVAVITGAIAATGGAAIMVYQTQTEVRDVIKTVDHFQASQREYQRQLSEDLRLRQRATTEYRAALRLEINQMKYDLYNREYRNGGQ